MKTLGIISLSIIILISCNQTKGKNISNQIQQSRESVEDSPLLQKDTIFTFEKYKLGKTPSGWTQYFTGRGEMTDWKIMEENGNKVLAQLSEQDMGRHFNEVVFDGFKMKNLELKVKIKALKGKRDQGGGFVWRFIDENNHYILRANPLEDNVVLYKMENGKRKDLPILGKGSGYGIDVDTLGNHWNSLKLIVIDDLFTVFLNDKEIFQVKDNTFPDAGKVGLWTKADAVSYFDNFEVINK